MRTAYTVFMTYKSFVAGFKYNVYKKGVVYTTLTRNDEANHTMLRGQLTARHCLLRTQELTKHSTSFDMWCALIGCLVDLVRAASAIC